MSRIRSVARRVLRHSRRQIRRDVDEIRTLLVDVQSRMETVDRIVQDLNHEIRHGAGESLPLFMGYAERLRLDAETAVGVAQLIERRLFELEDRLDGNARD
ncbi:MAG: hypothetical protein B7C54_01665 [Acidimicrobiales bacterium mtb01]|nr:hypothetical protein [Actinomycetota bacterium]TEX47798.1 MAG: hypothetical protein B7C54_01665 [Acidimicrobiales bacterium mtb01]